MRHFSMIVLGLAILGATGCGVGEIEEDERASEQGEAELVVDPSGILGDIELGQTVSDIAFTCSPLRRAFRFTTTTPNQAIDIWARSTADATVWLTKADFTSLEYNDNADASTRDAHIARKLRNPGTYYLVFKEKNCKPATFSVTLGPSTALESWATLTAQLPAGTCLPGESCTRPLAQSPSIAVDGSTVAIGAGVRLQPGAHRLTVDDVLFPVEVAAGQSRTVVLPVARSRCQAAGAPPIAVQTDFGSAPIFRNAACPTSLSTMDLVQSTDLSPSDRAYAPGAYSYTVEGSAPVSVTLNEGEQREIEISLPVIGGDLFHTTVRFLEARELPDAAVATITSSVSGERSYRLPAGTAISNLNLQAYKNSSALYTFTAAGRTVALSQTGSNTLSLNRVDVDDVTVTREDSSTYVARGTYELYFGGICVAGPYDTATGIDVLPGDYELVLKYRTADGEKIQRQTLSF
ncbi:MAG: hypothetical protein HY901_03950 [Deltaproteobacteria bacterium]|nr:hypothetical protein [Deltaproteobacteria bacterium]